MSDGHFCETYSSPLICYFFFLCSVSKQLTFQSFEGRVQSELTSDSSNWMQKSLPLYSLLWAGSFSLVSSRSRLLSPLFHEATESDLRIDGLTKILPAQSSCGSPFQVEPVFFQTVTFHLILSTFDAFNILSNTLCCFSRKSV